MLPIALIAALALTLAAPAALAQESDSEPRRAVPRFRAPVRAPEPPPAAEPAPEPQRTAEPQRAPEPQRAAEPQRQAVPRGSRPREDNPPVGVAVPRRVPARPPVDQNDRVRGYGGGPRIVNRGAYRTPTVYNNYYYYPRRSYPYGYGAFGLGYFYYDPYRWYPGSYGVYIGSGSGYYGGSRYSHSVFDIGELRLRVSPRHAQVFVDGYYVGVVDDFDSMFQGIKLEEGPYRIEIAAPGFAPLEFDVRILPGQKITYRGDLLPQRP